MTDPLPASALCWSCDLENFDFETTDDLPDVIDMFGQERVGEALQFAVAMDFPGYNIFALGPEDVGKHAMIVQYLRARAETREAPADWCYVSNFLDQRLPRYLRLPNGRGSTLQGDMTRFVEDCRAALISAFESEEYRTRHQVIDEELKERQDQALAEIEKDAQEHGIALLRTPVGFALSPVENGKIVSPEDFQSRPAEERKKVEVEIERLQELLKDALRDAPMMMKEARDRVRELRRETASFAVIHLVDALKESYRDLPNVVAYLADVGDDIVENVGAFLGIPSGPEQPDGGDPKINELPILRRYEVNLLVRNGGRDRAPVIFEDNPTYDRLIGRIEHRAEMGALTTDFTLIRPGALHRANGGYLIIDARNLLLNPFSWDGLKHALRMHEVRIEPPAHGSGVFSTLSLEPQPVPLDVKVVLVGDPRLYYMLLQADPEFGHLFKVAADFEDRFDRTPELDRLYARLVATQVRGHKLRRFSRAAVAAVLEQSARQAGDSQKLSARVERVSDLLREADFHAGKADRKIVEAEDIDRAVESRTFRTDRIHRHMHAEITRGTILIDTDGEKVGQINGLSVMAMGEYSFGKPSRVTARVRLGQGKLIDIEREVTLGGPLHSKGVLILSGYLNATYAPLTPLSLGATLVFEQSYGGIDGDSASSTELYALLSAISGFPIRQAFAVTGSVNQAGEVQAIGGVNEKIEGYFDICMARGLTGDQGVLIPQSNVVHLMLNKQVIKAVTDGDFNIYPVSDINQGIEILTGVPAGERGPDGDYPPDTVNRSVEDKLIEMARTRRDFSRTGAGDNETEGDNEQAGEDGA